MSDYDEYKEWIKDYEKSSGEKVDKDSIEREGHGWEGHEVLKFCNKGGECFFMVENEDEAVAIAEEQVREDLEREPELFNQSWLRQHLDTDRMIEDMVDDFDEWTSDDEATNWFSEDEIREALNMKKNADVSEVSMSDMQGTSIYDDKARERAEDVVENGSDFDSYFPSDVLMNYLDIDEATEDAVSTDGWAHFIISHYDGSYKETKKGRVYWRD